MTEVALSLALFTVIYGVLAVIEAGLLWRYVKAGPTHLVPPQSDDSDEDRDTPVPAFVY